MKILAEEVLVLVIDIQERLVVAMKDNEKYLDNTSRFLRGIKELQIETIVTQQYKKGLGETKDNIKELVENATFFDKISYSCLKDEAIKEAVIQSNKKVVLICGIEAHICVLQTAIDLKEEGFIPVVVEDCIASRKDNDKAVALKRMEKEGVYLTTYESVLFEMLQTAKHDKFKNISSIIK